MTKEQQKMAMRKLPHGDLMEKIINDGSYKSFVSEALGKYKPVRNVKVPKTIYEELKIGRNEQCPCKSGKKYKKCCINKVQEEVKHEKST